MSDRFPRTVLRTIADRDSQALEDRVNELLRSIYEAGHETVSVTTSVVQGQISGTGLGNMNNFTPDRYFAWVVYRDHSA